MSTRTRTYFIGGNDLRTDPNLPSEITARSHADAWRQLAGLLSVSGARRLTAYSGAIEVCASLYDGGDRITDVDRQRNLPLPR